MFAVTVRHCLLSERSLDGVKRTFTRTKRCLCRRAFVCKRRRVFVSLLKTSAYRCLWSPRRSLITLSVAGSPFSINCVAPPENAGALSFANCFSIVKANSWFQRPCFWSIARIAQPRPLLITSVIAAALTAEFWVRPVAFSLLGTLPSKIGVYLSIADVRHLAKSVLFFTLC